MINFLIIFYVILQMSTGINLTVLHVMVSLYCTLILLIIAYYTQQMTEYGHKELERVLGFRHFMMVAEKDWIDRLAKDDPKFFYDRLPYALVLGVSRVWIGKFADTITAPPEWYTSSTNTPLL